VGEGRSYGEDSEGIKRGGDFGEWI